MMNVNYSRLKSYYDGAKNRVSLCYQLVDMSSGVSREMVVNIITSAVAMMTKLEKEIDARLKQASEELKTLKWYEFSLRKKYEKLINEMTQTLSRINYFLDVYAKEK